jgi:hypothetical protein
MTVGALAAVVYPLMRGQEADRPKEAEWRLKELFAAKNTIYSTLKELDFDRVAGKLSDSDFRQLEAQYREQAIQVLREIDELVEGRGKIEDIDADLSGAVEREILALRKATREQFEPVQETVESAPPVDDTLDVPPEPRFCSNCGIPVSSTDNFCSSCGTTLRKSPQGDAD